MDDISLFLETDAPVWEPFDVTSLQHILQTPIKQYVRVFDQEVIEHIFDPALLGGKNIIDHDKPLNGIIDCRIQGDDHPQWTILTSGGLLPSTIKVCDQFAGQGIGSDFFLRVNYQQTEHDALADHLKQTGKLAIILDHEMNDELQEYIDELCEYVGLDANHCVVIVPQIDKVTTHQRDYLYEQAGLGVGGIVEKL